MEIQTRRIGRSCPSVFLGTRRTDRLRASRVGPKRHVAEQVRAQIRPADLRDDALKTNRKRAARLAVAAGNLGQVRVLSAGVRSSGLDDLGGCFVAVEKRPKLGHAGINNLFIHERYNSNLLNNASIADDNLSISEPVALGDNRRMDTKSIRTHNLALIVEHEGSIAEVARKTGAADPYLSQILNGVKSSTGTPRGMGHKLARQIEAGLSLEHGWMDIHHDAMQADNIGHESAADDADAYAIDAEILCEIFEYLEIRRAQLGAKPSTPEQMAGSVSTLYPEFKRAKERDQQQRRQRNIALADRTLDTHDNMSTTRGLSTTSKKRDGS